MQLRDVRAADVQGKRVLVRVDYNVGVSGGRVRDTYRLEASLPTVRWLIRHGAKVILLSHRGRPSGRAVAWSLRPMIKPLSRLLGQPVRFVSTPVSAAATRRDIDRLPAGHVALLENLRFSPGEDRASAALARALARLGDVYVNDAFAVSHRPSASMVRLPKLLPAYAGLNLQAEYKHLAPLLGRPRRPYVAILGGAKISTKLGLIRRLLKQADHVLLGGALANTVLQAEGLAIGSSLTESTMLRQARGLSVKNRHLHIPCDVLVVRGRLRSGVQPVARPVGAINRDQTIVDIGPDTVDLFRRVIRSAATIVWNGPMGVYEVPAFAAGTKALARAIAQSPAQSVAGGGETVDAIRRQGLANKFNFISTGGGAMVEFLEGRRLPGLLAVAKR